MRLRTKLSAMISGLVKWLGIVTAASAIVGTTWAATDYLGVRPATISELRLVQASVDEINQYVALQRYQWLVAKRDSGGGLTVEEQYELCAISAYLGFDTPGCR